VEKFPFRLPEGFNLRDHLANSFGIFDGPGRICVKIRFLSTVARYVHEKHWHASQRLTPQADGSLLAEFCLGSLEEVKSWVLGFGRHAEVLEPEGLREEMEEECRAMIRRYGAAERQTDVLETMRDKRNG
jgi:predicted DNA-binding transcriptional regulator YafY